MDNGQCLETLLQPLTPSLTEAIEQYVYALVECFRGNEKEAMTWTSVAVAKSSFSRARVALTWLVASLCGSVVHLVTATSPEQLEWNEFSAFIRDDGQFGSCFEAFDESTLVHYSIN
ncbi:hypothetical protein PsorP6_012013 [Peronosclerospora sorghi]|uniref:Uncharacterized protein n=1 Tax=Peronosclerospora sorghi TaxID=230839 RepID=A0ACC0WMM9_9STRA|nr:hypothetical protein PsorP6_012013 [Peronosclerospora sorghi]